MDIGRVLSENAYGKPRPYCCMTSTLLWNPTGLIGRLVARKITNDNSDAYGVSSSNTTRLRKKMKRFQK